MLACIILCGGKGTRIRSITEDQKCMLEFSGKPFLSILLNDLNLSLFDRVFLAAGHKADDLNDLNFSEIQDSVEIVEEKTPLGTGGAINNIVKKTNFKNYLVMNGDTYQLGKTPSQIISIKKPNKMNVGVSLMGNSSRYSIVKKNKSVLKFVKPTKPKEKLWVLNGIFNLQRELFSNVIEENFSLEYLFNKNNFLHREVKIVKFPKGFIDFGVPEDFKRLKKVLG